MAKVNDLLEGYKKDLENGNLKFTVKSYGCGLPSDVYACIVEFHDIETYKFLLKHIHTKDHFEEVAKDVCREFCKDPLDEEISYYYDPYNLYLIWNEVSYKGIDTNFLFELENKRRNGCFRFVPAIDAQKEKTLHHIIKEKSVSPIIIQSIFRMFTSKKRAIDLRHEPDLLFDKEFGERRRKMLKVQEHLWEF